MAGELKIGVIGLVHDHVWEILEQFKDLPDAVITSVADVNPPLLSKVKEHCGVKKTYTNYEDLLKKEKVDAVLVYTENSRHAEITEAAAERGIHVMVEKPMAANLEQAERMFKASHRYGIKLMINYPTAWFPAMRYEYSLAKEGRIGKVYMVRYRAAHEGPKEIGCSPYFYEWLYNPELNGAGAFMDYCCYGANMCRWILGVPEKVTALGGTYVRDYLTVEDNAILLMGYPKAIGIAEASWSQIGEGIPPRYTLILNGSEGVMAAGKAALKVYTAENKRWEELDVPPLEAGRRNGPEHFTRCILEDKPVDDLLSPLYNRDSQAILEAGLTSMKEERTVHLSELGFK
ncbi:TPA: Gfo/Idh/MocA family oxidoreductase [Candidatus Bathyarchaeota archaeon]|nr:Gfo/Idh/MocA family oxidoreductase [Candidatus Bathyarchaeota archaeon]